MPQKDITLERLEAHIYEIIDDLKENPISEAELNKAKNNALAQDIFRRDSPERIGAHIGQLEIAGYGWEGINEYPVNIQKVNTEDIMAAAAKYFTEDNRTVGYLVPTEVK